MAIDHTASSALMSSSTHEMPPDVIHETQYNPQKIESYDSLKKKIQKFLSPTH